MKAQPCFFLQSAGRNNYEKSVQHLVDIEKYRNLLGEEFRAVRKCFPSGKVRLYGLRRDSAGQADRLWNKMEIGDVILFSGKGLLRSMATVVHKCLNHQLAKELWGVSDTGRSFELLYFLDDFRELGIPSEQFNKAAGYGPTYAVQSAFRLKDEQVKSVRKLLKI